MKTEKRLLASRIKRQSKMNDMENRVLPRRCSQKMYAHRGSELVVGQMSETVPLSDALFAVHRSVAFCGTLTLALASLLKYSILRLIFPR